MADGNVPAGLQLEYKGLYELLNYWRRMGRDGLPSRADIDPTEIPGLLRHLLLIDVERAPVRFRARLCGTAIDRAFGRSYTGCYLDDINAGYFERDVLSDYARVVLCKRPHFACRSVLAGNGDWIRYQRLLLPLCSNGWEVDMLLGGVSTTPIEDSAHRAPDYGALGV